MFETSAQRNYGPNATPPWDVYSEPAKHEFQPGDILVCVEDYTQENVLFKGMRYKVANRVAPAGLVFVEDKPWAFRPEHFVLVERDAALFVDVTFEPSTEAIEVIRRIVREELQRAFASIK